MPRFVIVKPYGGLGPRHDTYLWIGQTGRTFGKMRWVKTIAEAHFFKSLEAATGFAQISRWTKVTIKEVP